MRNRLRYLLLFTVCRHFLCASSLQSALDAAVAMNDLSIVVDILNIINLQP